MKKFFSILVIAAVVASISACDDDDATPEEPTPPAPDVVVITENITQNTTWNKSNIYELAGRISVLDGVTLTIEAGTVVKGREGQGTNASALMIARGGKLNAIGTSDQPIIFTSVLDDIIPGQASGSNLDEDDKGLWGGLVILGKAPISYSGSLEAQIEGVPSGDPLGLYGGSVPDDNSGTIKFVSIRHGGTEIAGGSEINGLTLGGVGSGTTISDIEVFANVDDGIEFFGGSVNVSNVLIAHQGDDGIDIDQAYSGVVDGFLVVHGGDTNQGLEIDGPEGTENASGKFVLKNGTLIGAGDAANPADFKSGAQGTVENVVFQGYNDTRKIMIAASYNDNCELTGNAFKNLLDGNLIFTTINTSVDPDVYSSGNCDTAEADATAAGMLMSDDSATGAPASTTWSWTLTAEKSMLP